MTFAREVAGLIHDETQSGSAAWDELNGPDAVLSEVTGSDGSLRYTIMLPMEYDDDGAPVFTRTCLIVIEERGKP